MALTNRLIVGILTTHLGPWPPERQERFDAVAAVATKHGLTVVTFTPEEINWQYGYVTGLRYSRRGWVPARLPIPSVVYNRLPSRKSEREAHVELDRLTQRLGPRFFNPHFFNKWQIHEILVRTPLAPYLPATRRYDELTDLYDFIARHRAVYFKPLEAQAGRGIMACEPGPEGWRLSCNLNDGQVVQLQGRLTSMLQTVESQVGETPYLIQAAIHPLTHQGRPFDLRCLVQKTGNGTWRFVGLGVRRAAPGGITTHVPRGGERLRLSQVLKPSVARVYYERVQELVNSVAQTLDDAYSGALGELTCDVGIDTNGNLWVFEVNSRPARFDEPHLCRLNYQLLGQYLNYLARRHPPASSGQPEK